MIKLLYISLLLIIVLLSLHSEAAVHGKLHDIAREVMSKNLPPTMSSHKATMARAHGINIPSPSPSPKEHLSKYLLMKAYKKKREREKKLGMKKRSKKQRDIHRKHGKNKANGNKN